MLRGPSVSDDINGITPWENDIVLPASTHARTVVKIINYTLILHRYECLQRCQWKYKPEGKENNMTHAVYYYFFFSNDNKMYDNYKVGRRDNMDRQKFLRMPTVYVL